MTGFKTLHVWVPALVLCGGIGLIAIGYSSNVQRRVERRLEILRVDAYAQATRLSGIAQHLYRKGPALRGTADLELSYSSAAPELELGLICDGDDIVLHSTRLQWRTVPLTETPVAEAATLLRQARVNMSGVVQTSANGRRMFSIFPFLQHAAKSVGAVVLSYDLALPIAEAHLLARHETIQQGFALLAGCLLLWLVLDLLITSRVDAILQYAREVAAGRNPPSPPVGGDEIGAVSAGFARTVEKLMQTELKLLEASEHERRRIGRDLHDDVCQRITAAQIKVGVLGAAMAREGHARNALAGEVASELSEAAQVARGFARGLAPAALDRDGLPPALNELASYLTRSFSVHCEATCDLNGHELSSQAQTHLHRIAQELATNAAKHAGATWIRIDLNADNEHVRLEVENDGQLFLGDDESDGLGLHFVMQRVRALSGKIEFCPRTSGKPGTLALCEVPMSGIQLDHQTVNT